MPGNETNFRICSQNDPVANTGTKNAMLQLGPYQTLLSYLREENMRESPYEIDRVRSVIRTTNVALQYRYFHKGHVIRYTGTKES